MLWTLKKTGLADGRSIKGKYNTPTWLLTVIKELKKNPLYIGAKKGSYHCAVINYALTQRSDLEVKDVPIHVIKRVAATTSIEKIRHFRTGKLLTHDEKTLARFMWNSALFDSKRTKAIQETADSKSIQWTYGDEYQLLKTF